MEISKKEYRNKYSLLRRSLTNAQLISYNRSINEQLKSIVTGNIHLFLPIKAKIEVDIWPFIDHVRNSNFTIGTSIYNSANNSVKHVEILNSSIFEAGDYQIPKPTIYKEVEISIFNTIIIPLLAYDENGNRVGYGKGIYDEILEKCNEKCTLIGVSFFKPEKKIVSEKHDIPLNYCINPIKLVKF